MDAVCLLVAGALRATLPTTDFTLSWRHSVEKTLIVEHYQVHANDLVLVEARMQGLGAGMEPAQDAVLSGGWWIWHPTLPPLPTLRITRSDYTRDYSVCWKQGCKTLTALTRTAGDVAVDVRACWK